MLDYIRGNYEFVNEFFYNEKVQFKRGLKYYLNAPTGTGKTSYMKELVKNNPNFRFCILVNRTALMEQISYQLKNNSIIYTPNGKYKLINDGEIPKNVEIVTYQGLEVKCLNLVAYIQNFDFVICEEFHYFLEDSLFNPRVNISYHAIMQATKPCFLMISATGHDVINLMESHPLNLNQGILLEMVNTKRNRGKLNFFRKSDDIVDLIIKDTKEYEKWMIFVDSKIIGKKMKELLKKNGTKVAYIDSDTTTSSSLNDIIHNEEYNEKVLICTSVLDNGINIKDRNVRNLVIFSNSPTEMKQMYGRRRLLDSSDWFNVFLTIPNKSQLKTKINRIDNILKKYERWYNDFCKFKGISYLFGENSEDGILYREAFYMRGNNYYFNHLGFQKLHLQKKQFIALYNSNNVINMKKNVFRDNFILNDKIIERQEDLGKAKLFTFLRAYENKKMGKEDYTKFRSQFRDIVMNIYAGQTSFRADRLPSDKVINSCMDENSLPYLVMKDSDLNRTLKYKI